MTIRGRVRAVSMPGTVTLRDDAGQPVTTNDRLFALIIDRADVAQPLDLGVGLDVTVTVAVDEPPLPAEEERQG